MKRGTLNLISSLVFLLLVIGGYYYIWKNATLGATPLSNSTIFIPIDIAGIKGQADILIKARQNNAGIPIPNPTEKLGKPVPFNSPE